MKSSNYLGTKNLFTTYEIRAGDTFETIARRVYGNELKAEQLARSNPGVIEPLVAGVVLTIPPDPDTPVDQPQRTAAASENQVAVKVDGNVFTFWDNVRLTSAVDMMDTAEFGAPMDSALYNFRETFKVNGFQPMEVTVGGEPLFTGNIVGMVTEVSGKSKTVTVSAYSTPGVLNDCTPPASSYPVEFNGQGLQEIATTLAGDFGIKVVFNADQGSTFETVACEPGRTVLSFLTELAKERNLVISSTPLGGLLFWRSVPTGNPVASLVQGAPPLASVRPQFSAQQIYSHITGIEPVILGHAGSQFTVENPRLKGVLRPYTFDVPDSLDADVPEVVRAKLGRMYANMASFTVEVPTWRDASGNLWQKNTTVKLTAPDAFVYREGYEFVIRSVELRRDGTAETATLTLVLPGSFSGEVPEVLPWED